MYGSSRNVCALALLTLLVSANGCGTEMPPFDTVDDVGVADVVTDSGTLDQGIDLATSSDDGLLDIGADVEPDDADQDVAAQDVVHDVCIADCSDRECGDDGCGGSCGSCGVAMACSEEFKCATVSCDSDLTCQPYDAVCDPLSKECVACLTAEDCPDGSYACLGFVCTEVQFCSSSLDCTDQVCDPVRGYCVSCTEGADCGTNAVCRDVTCFEVTPCESSLDCTAQVCNKDKGYCVDCLTDADCGQNSECVDDACNDFVPCDTDLTCTPLGQLCDKDAGRCERCLTDDECPDVYHCDQNDCVLDICVPGSGSCDGNVAVECLANGSGFGEPIACGNEQYCKAGVCYDQICDPDSVSCNDNVLETCNSIGSDYLSRQDCTDKAVCLNAQCVSKICDPLETECKSDFSWSQCNLYGTAWGTATSCPTGFYCDGGTCEAQVCQPSTAYCVDEATVAMCDDKGSAPSLTQACEAEQVCVGGTCFPVVCTPGVALCSANGVTTCNALGSGYDYVLCGDDEYCEAGECHDRVCDPSSVVCNGSVVETCNALGSALESSYDCSTDGLPCFGGECGVPDEMVLIPEGSFWMGCNSDVDSQCLAWEKPYHEVSLSAYLIDRTEVTLAEYEACVSDGYCSIPSGTEEGCNWGNSDQKNNPVVCTTFEQSSQYCSWIGGRLPTEAEWERAARGSDGLKYPWGNTTVSCDYAVMASSSSSSDYGCGSGTSWTVCGKSPAGDSPEGLCDMSGNVWEWVSDWYSATYYSSSPTQDPTGPTTGTSRIVRGGSFIDPASTNFNFRTSHRGTVSPSIAVQNVGFRCVKSSL